MNSESGTICAILHVKDLNWYFKEVAYLNNKQAVSYFYSHFLKVHKAYEVDDLIKYSYYWVNSIKTQYSLFMLTQ